MGKDKYVRCVDVGMRSTERDGISPHHETVVASITCILSASCRHHR